MKIGVLGGTFDPIHNGHLIMASSALHRGLDQILFLPTGRPRYKEKSLTTSAETRFEMVRAAIRGENRFQVSREEIDRDGYSYSLDTMRRLKEGNGHQWYFLMGADSLLSIESWHGYEDFLLENSILVFSRPGEREDLLQEKIRSLKKAHIECVPMPRMEISSTWIRQWVGEEKALAGFLPFPVMEIIQRERLYADQL